MLTTNIQAPLFELLDDKGEKFQLKDLIGKQNIVLVFYPFDWSPVCSDQIALYSQMHGIFEKLDATLVGISVDSIFCHAAFIENRNLKIHLLSDSEPKGKIAKLYGVYNEKEGHASRALFVIDKKGNISWHYLSPDNENPGADGIIEALENLK